MHGWQAGLLRLVHAVLQSMHVLLRANTGANDLQTSGSHVHGHCSWQAECRHG